MSKLYELAEEYNELLEMMEDDSVDMEVLRDTLEGVEGEIEIKAENLAKIIKELDGTATMIETEINRLKAKKDAISNNAKSAKKYLESVMIATGKKKFKTDLFGFSIQKNPPSLVIDQEEDIPDEYWVAQKPKLDNTALKKWLKENKSDFAHLEQTESLRIR